jgi:hypothetical protein
MPMVFPGKIPKQHKYRARRVVVDGISFASAKEAKRYGELKLLQRGKQISDLRLQVRYKLVMEVVYVADFAYYDRLTGKQIVEDAKGFRTNEYKRKKKLMLEQHGIEVTES